MKRVSSRPPGRTVEREGGKVGGRKEGREGGMLE